jgi:hypothetical protein
MPPVPVFRLMTLFLWEWKLAPASFSELRERCEIILRLS